MDGKPVQIISIDKDKNNKSTYKFKYDALHETLNEVNNLEVAVVSISGPSRQGKSFLLSYLLRYLSNPNDNDWIGKDNEPLKGFKWSDNTVPETKGIWVWSKPLIVKQINKEIAIIIMDTQGVYDEFTDSRDWSTIVGITLLTSSCFIYNVFSDIKEDVLAQLETFINYGLLAMSKNETKNHAFQRLLFLIRDWNFGKKIKFGHKGGKEYIDQKLSIKSGQTPASQRTRKLIRECFEDVTCYLMPQIGSQKDEQDFNGSVCQLDDKFVDKLEELFSVLLSPESLKPKVINGITVNGKDLIKYFEIFVEIFNGDELPQPMDLVEAVARANDLILISKMKETFCFELNKELQTRLFISRYELETLDTRMRNAMKNDFQTSKKSQNFHIIKEITQTFETDLKEIYKKIYNENEDKREKIANNTIAKCVNIYRKSMNHLMNEYKFMNGYTFDEHSQKSKKMAMEYYTKIFGDEELDSYAPYLNKINKSIEDSENSFRTKNYKQKSEFKKIKAQAIDDCLTLYCEQIETVLNENVFLTPEKFNQCEQEIRGQSLEYANKCFEDEDSVRKYEELLRLKLNEAKSKLENSNRDKMMEITDNTESELNSALINCKEKLADILDNFTGSEDLNKIMASIKQNTIEIFNHKCVVKDTNFMKTHTRKLESEIEKSFSNFIKGIESKTQDLKNFYDKTVGEAMHRYFVPIQNLFEGKSLISNEESNNFKESLISDVMKKYENIPQNRKLDEIKEYVNQKSAYAADQFLTKKLIETYCEKMTEKSLTKIFFSREELKLLHEQNSREVIEIIIANKKSNDSIISSKLNDDLKTRFEEFNSKNEQKRNQIIGEVIKNCFSIYKKCMTQTLDHVCVESHRFEELNLDSMKKALNYLIESCGEEKELIELYSSNLKKLIKTTENDLKTGNDIKIIEARRKNCEAVKKSLNYYSERMSTAVNKGQFQSKESFRRYENDVREETKKIFSENAKYGEIEFIEKFESDLDTRINSSKYKIKSSFLNNMADFDSEINTEIENGLSQYNQFMSIFIDALHSEEMFNSKHEELKENFIKKFKMNCSFKDGEYQDRQVSKLENAINVSRNKFHEALLTRIKKYENYYEKSIDQSFATYAKLMKEFLDDNRSISEDELKNSHQNVIKDVMSKFEKIFENEDDNEVIELNRIKLEIKIMNEFENYMKINRMRHDSEEKSDMKLKLKMNDYIKEYETKMLENVNLCSSEDELLEKHLEIKDIIKEKLEISSPFSNSELLEPYLIDFEAYINESFYDFNTILKVNLKNQSLYLQNVIRNARKFFRKEMNKYYAETNFLKSEILSNHNIAEIDRTIAKYQCEKGNMSIEAFGKIIKESLEDIYKDIVNENRKNTPTTPSIGIDLGTTNSCVAYYQPSKGITIIVPNELGHKTTPSIVAFGDDSGEVIGEAAKDQSYRNSRNTVYSAKRLIGRKFDDKIVQKDMKLWPFKVVGDKNNPKICVKVGRDDKSFFPEEISAKILKKLKQTAETHLGCKVKNAVITVPAYFNEAQKQATKDAGKIAGLNVLKIINEPTAAAIAFQLNRSDESFSRKVLIFDFGGGTLDIVVLVIERGLIDIKAVGGDNHLGGDDINAKLVEYCLKEFTEKTQIQIDEKSEEGQNALRRLTNECDKHKRQLCTTNKAEIIVDHFYKRQDLSCELTREKFDELNNDLFVKSTDLVAKVLSDAKFKYSDIDDVVLVGGTTRIPKIRDMLSDMFDKPLNHSVNPDEAVAVGAAIQAAILNGTLAENAGRLRVSDVTPMSLGIKLKDGSMSVIIHRNSKVPNKHTVQYGTAYDNQRVVNIEIYEGEETIAKDNRKLGSFNLSNIPPGIAGKQKIDVTFHINDEGLLHVSAKILSNGEEEEILITEHKGRLTDAELEILIEQENQ